MNSSSPPEFDHFIISLSYALNIHFSHPRSPHSFNTLNYSQADWVGLNDYLCDIDFNTCFDPLNIDNSWDALLQEIMDAFNILIPRYTPKASSPPRWFTPQIKHLLNKSRTIRKRLRSCNNSNPVSFSNLTSKLESIQEDLSNSIACAKEEYIQRLLSTYGSNKSKLLNHLSSLKSIHSIPHTVHYNDLQASDPANKANLFNSFFNTTFSTSSFEAPSLTNLPLPLDSPVISDFGPDEVYNALVALDVTKSQGPSGISPRVLKECATVLAQPFADFFTICINSASIPSQWKVHLIVPIPKSGNRSVVNNYRPISLLSNISKLFEKLIFDKISDFIYSRISPNQFGL